MNYYFGLMFRFQLLHHYINSMSPYVLRDNFLLCKHYNLILVVVYNNTQYHSLAWEEWS
jgi:protein associated with RNAse G/E